MFSILTVISVRFEKLHQIMIVNNVHLFLKSISTLSNIFVNQSFWNNRHLYAICIWFVVCSKKDNSSKKWLFFPIIDQFMKKTFASSNLFIYLFFSILLQILNKCRKFVPKTKKKKKKGQKEIKKRKCKICNVW